jgi:hypothetical protein
MPFICRLVHRTPRWTVDRTGRPVGKGFSRSFGTPVPSRACLQGGFHRAPGILFSLGQGAKFPISRASEASHRSRSLCVRSNLRVQSARTVRVRPTRPKRQLTAIRGWTTANGHFRPLRYYRSARTSPIETSGICACNLEGISVKSPEATNVLGRPRRDASSEEGDQKC